MARVTKNPVERRREILEAALGLFSEKGFELTTIQDIAEKLHISQGLCYRYFKSKQDLFAAASDLYAETAVLQLFGPDDKGENAVDRFNAVIGRLLSYAIKHSEFEATYNHAPQMRAEQIHYLVEHAASVIIPIVRNGDKEEVFHCDDVENTVRLITFGILDVIHVSMPTVETKQYIRSYVPTIRSVCEKVLSARPGVIGAGWEQL